MIMPLMKKQQKPFMIEFNGVDLSDKEVERKPGAMKVLYSSFNGSQWPNISFLWASREHVLPHCQLAFHFIIIIIIYTFLQYSSPSWKFPWLAFISCMTARFFGGWTFPIRILLTNFFGESGRSENPRNFKLLNAFSKFLRSARSNQTPRKRLPNGS